MSQPNTPTPPLPSPAAPTPLSDAQFLRAVCPILQAAVRGDALTGPERDLAHAAFYVLPRIGDALSGLASAPSRNPNHPAAIVWDTQQTERVDWFEEYQRGWLDGGRFARAENRRVLQQVKDALEDHLWGETDDTALTDAYWAAVTVLEAVK